MNEDGRNCRGGGAVAIDREDIELDVAKVVSLCADLDGTVESQRLMANSVFEVFERNQSFGMKSGFSVYFKVGDKDLAVIKRLRIKTTP